MSGLLEGAKNLVSRGGDLGDRLDGLTAATVAATGRLDDGLVEDARSVVNKAQGRLKLSADHTVVGVAGATGSGKSSTFNALTGLELSAVGVRRPTTSWATACVWGSEGAQELLEWLGIPERHQTTRDSMLDTRREGHELDGVVLLDLPDHDSTEVSHHLEVDRLVELADMLVWVLDPQKYADAAIHDRYLQPLRTHSEIMVVVLNHIDRVPEDRRESMLGDVRRLLDQDGLRNVTVIPVSAKLGWGIPQLKTEIAQRAAAKRANKSRLSADIKTAAVKLAKASGDAKPRSLAKPRVEALEDAISEAAGVPTVVDAVERSVRTRARAATGWPLVSWVSRLKPDPLKRLHLALGEEATQLAGRARTSLPQTTAVERARVDTEVRQLADEAGAGLASPWRDAIRRASVSRMGDLADRLDASVGGVDLNAERLPLWTGLVKGLQWLLIILATVGLVWSVALLLSGAAQVGDVTPSVAGVEVPYVLFIGGVGLGLVLWAVCHLLVITTARRRARAADARLRTAVADVSRELVVDPIETELAAYTALRHGVAKALR